MKRFSMSELRPMPRTTAVVVWALILGQGAVLSPLIAGELGGRLETLQQWSAQATAALQQRLPAKPVRVNRTVPRVTPPSLTPHFSAIPTAEEITRARVFREPLVPLEEPTREENVALAAAVLEYRSAGGAHAEQPWRQFLDAYPKSSWRPSILVSLGTIVRDRGGFSEALDLWDAAWRLTRDRTDTRSRAIADLAIAEWMTTAGMFGQAEMVRARGAELVDRDVRGVAGAKVGQALETAAMVADRPGLVLASGPEALKAILRGQGRSSEDINDIPAFRAYVPTALGMTLGALEGMASAVGLPMKAVTLEGATAIPVPAIVHWKLGHYSAVVEQVSGRYRVEDVALGGSRWVDSATLLAESSGHILVPESGASAFRRVGADELSVVVGHSCPDLGPAPGPPGPCGGGGSGPPPPPPPPGPGGCSSGRCGGMPYYDFHPVEAALHLQDTPVFYQPPRGPGGAFTLSYNHRESFQPQLFSFSHVGPKWTFNWISYVQEEPALVCQLPGCVWIYLPGGWRDTFSQPNGSGVYAEDWRTRSTLVRTSVSPLRFERRWPDGSIEVFGQPDGAPAGYQRVFRTELRDPQGLTQTFTYDAQYRLVAATDAVGQVTTLSYEDGADPLRVTKVTDPFGRTALLTYNGAGQLASITDAIGMTSSFTYGTNDFISHLTTPYGTTTFREEQNPYTTFTYRFIEATDPEGGHERTEFRWDADPALVAAEPAAEVPTGFASFNVSLDRYNSVSWTKRGWALGPGNPAMATVTRWLGVASWPGGTNYAVPVPHSVKRPEERRVWYQYPGQTSAFYLNGWSQPSNVARVLDNGVTQSSLTTYNAKGKISSRTDPLGRQTTYTYAANGMDLLEVRQVNGGATDLLASYANYNALHLPGTTTDGAGQTTILIYNAAGQPLTITNAKNEATTYVYDTEGNLQTVTGPVANSTTTYTEDGYGRVASITEPDGYTVTMLYDALNRLTRRTYPDGTYDETTFARLDVVTERDRKGRITRHFYDDLGRRTATRDPLGRVITQVWCACGSLDALIDANGNRTTWERDTQGRVIREVRADGTTDTLYTYDVTGRLKTVTDPMDQVTTHTYATDDSLLTTGYTNATIPTPSVTYTYDSIYPRVSTMVDGIGTTSYAYKAPGVLGAGQVASVDGPLTNDTIAYTYDQLGRVSERSINGAANTVTWAFDPLGRVISETNVLGPFTYTYDGVTSRLATVTYPNNQTSTYSYLPNNQDRRLQTIHHKYPNGTTLSKFDYTYDAVGNILTWRQQADAAAVSWRYGYDAADQLTSAVKESTDPVPVIQKRYAYGYDPAGNRLFEQIDDQVMAASHDVLNRLTQHTPGGPLQFVGTVNETANVTVAGRSVFVDPTNTFRGPAPTVNGTSTVIVTATDPSGNVASRQYEVDVTGAPKAFTYDANGNMTSDGTRTFEWDARNQLVAASSGTERTEFQFDGLRRRIRVIEKTGGVTVANLSYTWCEGMVCDARDAGGLVVERRYAAAEQIGGVARLLLRDHNGSARATSDSTAAVTARWEYDPWGRPSSSLGARFAELDENRQGLFFANNRAYDPSVGRWLSEDPVNVIEHAPDRPLPDGPNAYSYVTNRPTTERDPSGLQGTGAVATFPTIGEFCSTAAASALARALGVVGAIATQCGDSCRPEQSKCPPCTPPVGTVGYRMDLVPPSKPHYPFKGTHVHLYVRRQKPYPNCECVWNKLGIVDPPPPPGAVPMP